MLQPQFTKDTLPDSVSNDFQNLNKFNEQQFTSLTEILFNFLLEPKEADRFLHQLSEFAGENGMSAGPLRNLMKSVLLLPHGEIDRALTNKQIYKNRLFSCKCLKLVIRKGNSTENVYMELTLPQFYNFLHEMERAKASMDCFSRT
uniref:COMM domain containing 7 n=1 Tax=Salmo trutta TaxID=8032 RepID=A0A674BCK0_SALTR